MFANAFARHGGARAHRWMDETAFMTAYRKARRLAFSHAISLTQQYAPAAIAALTKVMTDPKSAAQARVSAATALLKFSREVIELDDLGTGAAAVANTHTAGSAPARGTSARAHARAASGPAHAGGGVRCAGLLTRVGRLETARGEYCPVCGRSSGAADLSAFGMFFDYACRSFAASWPTRQ